ncbi:molybdopterin molybdotransferase MoeA [Phyllobacterium endophyticum]|uniref:molybdopterin molybdotransferase MoeA n=1 Tax=Phyllobacterium endophyticum TaxID=1149773 RepID=UPI0011C9EB62|nr:gephyrin-like molybdotransferase Glp [Phyllobacterium endophyticum]TXR47001.1 molybdopterin molybdotransferase MoeA [Phyllobacterium endophyticum]
MAQLSNDCFAFSGPPIPLDDIVALLGERLLAVDGSETVSLSEADGRVLAADVIAPMSLPPFTNSAVDGYAVRHGDLSTDNENNFHVVGRVQAGQALDVGLSPAQAFRIFTGAAIPPGADTVFMQEDTRIDGMGKVVLPTGLKQGANVRTAGEDITIGQSVLGAGHRMRPQDAAVLAALGFTEAVVRRRVRVGVISTGNEIVEPGEVRGATQLFDSNRVMLKAMLVRLGCEVTDFGLLRDDPAAIAAALKAAAASHDLILTSGGVSTGEADYVRDAVETVGTLVFWRVAIKPGRPVAMGVIDGIPFIGLPGNPAASFVTFVTIVRPALLLLCGTPVQMPIPIPARATFSYEKKAGRREYVRANLTRHKDGTLAVKKFRREGAGLLSSLIETDGFVVLGEDTLSVRPGQAVKFIPYSSLF